MKTHYDLGLSKIYELVINANPSYAFLLDTNTLTDNTFVAAHVLGHSDFFKHNVWFRDTDRQMPETAAEHARRIRQYTQDVGDVRVERFLDAVLSIAQHVEPWPRRTAPPAPPAAETADRRDPYADLLPPGQRRARGRRAPQRPVAPVPPEPEADLLRFLQEHAHHLEDWQKDVIDIVRQETLYFVPQMMTKIMNEGWASYWHLTLMRDLGLSDAEFTEFARLHSAVCAPGHTRINPYHVGLNIWADIERRYGRQRLFEARELENDASFIRLYLTEELARDLDLYLFALQGEEWTVTSQDFERVRNALVDSLTNHGLPLITVEDADFHGRRECYLKHHHDNRQLDIPYAEKTLQYFFQIWQRPVHLETVVDDRTVVFSADGDRVSREVL